MGNPTSKGTYYDVASTSTLLLDSAGKESHLLACISIKPTANETGGIQR